MTEHWHKLPREAMVSFPCRSPSAAWTWAWAPCSECPCWTRGGPDGPEGFSHSVIL